MVALGFGKFARADRIFALERITGEERGDGRRTRVWIDGVADPLIASRTEGTILRDMGQESAIAAPELDEALDLAARLAAAADAGRVDLSDLVVGRDASWPRRPHPPRASGRTRVRDLNRGLFSHPGELAHGDARPPASDKARHQVNDVV